MEIGKQAKLALAGGQALAKDIEAEIRDLVISSAASIKNFHERREELTRVDHWFLFCYGLSLVLFFGLGARSWKEEESNGVIEDIAKDIVRAFRFQAAGESPPDVQMSSIAGQLRDVFENIRSNFGRLGEIAKNKDGELYTLMLMYLEQVHPASLDLLAAGNYGVFIQLAQRFSLLSISAHRYVPD